MDFNQLIKRAEDIHRSYKQFDKVSYGREWSPEEIALGLVGDVGDLARIVLTKSGVHNVDDADNALAIELSDCLFSIIVLARTYDIDLAKAFMQTMDELEERIEKGG